MRVMLALAVVLMGGAAPARGEPPAAEAFDDTFWDPEVVTPTGQPTRISESPSTTFVVTGDEIRASGAMTLPEILRRVPGLEVRSLSAADGQVSARGFVIELSNRVLVLLDGRTAHVDWLGNTVWDFLPVSVADIDRIEIVLGPGASVYGSKAMLGVINIITRSARDYPRLEAHSALAPQGDARYAFRYADIAGDFSGRINGSLTRMTRFGKPAEQEALDAGSGSFFVGYDPSPGFEASLEGGLSQGRTQVIATASRIDPYRLETRFLQADLRTDLGGPGAPFGEVRVRGVWKGGTIRSQTFAADSSDPDLDCPYFCAEFDTYYAEAVHVVPYELLGGTALLRWGGEVRNHTLDSTVTTNERDLLNLAAFASNELRLASWVINLGLRLDHQSLTELTPSPRASVIFEPSPGHQLRAAFNLGYNNPEQIRFFADMEVVPGIRLVGQDSLRKEKVIYGELGYTAALHRWVRTFINLFAYRMDDYAALNASEILSTGAFRFENNDPLIAYGLEVGGNIEVEQWLAIYGSYALLRQEGRGDFPYRGHNLGSPVHKAGGGVHLKGPAGTYATLDGQYFGKSELDRIPRVPSPGVFFEVFEMGAFAIVNGRAGVRLDNGVDISLSAANLLDDRTLQFPGGERPERRVFFHLAYYP